METILEIWSAQERLWLTVRSKSLSDLTSSSGLFKKYMGGFCQMVLLERQDECVGMSNLTSSKVYGPITFPSQTGRWSLSSTTSFQILGPLLFPCFVLPRSLQGVHNQPPLVKLPKCRLIAHLHSFVPLFLTYETSFHILLNLILPSKS